MSTNHILAPGLLALLLGACAGEADPASSAASDTTSATADPAPDQGYKSGLQTLDTGFDLSQLDSAVTAEERVAQVVARERPAVQARAGSPPSGGLQPAGSASRGSIQILGGGPIHDHGVVRQGETRDHTFMLVSDGEDPLVIRGVKPSCGCTKAEVMLVTEEGLQPYEQGKEIPIGQKLQLSTRIATVDKRPGDFAATVSLYTNDPRGPFSLQLKAQIEPVLVVEPEPAIHLRNMTVADTRESSVTVSSKRGEPFMLEPREGDVRKPMTVVLVPTEPDDDGRSSRWEIKITIGPNAPIGMRNYPLGLVSDIPIQGAEAPADGDEHETDADGHDHGSTQLTYSTLISVQARVTGLVHAEPGFVSFGMVRPGQVVERIVRLECYDDFELTTEIPVVMEGLYGQEFPYADAFTWQLEAVEGGFVDMRLRLEGLPDDANGSFGGILKLAVGHPWMDELAVRFSGVCRPGVSGG